MDQRSPGDSSAGAEPRGFTLIEMMVVLTVLAVLVAMVAPRFGGTYQEALLRAAGRELLSVMNLASSQAIATRQTISLAMEPSRGRYWLEAAGTNRHESWGAAAGQGETSALSKVPGAAGSIDSRIKVRLREPVENPQRTARNPAAFSSPRAAAGARATIRFRPDGTADAREILLEDEEGARLALRLHATTARVELQRLGREAR